MKHCKAVVRTEREIDTGRFLVVAKNGHRMVCNFAKTLKQGSFVCNESESFVVEALTSDMNFCVIVNS